MLPLSKLKKICIHPNRIIRTFIIRNITRRRLPVRHGQHVSVLIVFETPRFLRVYELQLTVVVERVILDGRISVDAHVVRVSARLYDPTVQIVHEFHAENFHLVYRDGHIRHLEIVVGYTMEYTGAVRESRDVSERTQL